MLAQRRPEPRWIEESLKPVPGFGRVEGSILASRGIETAEEAEQFFDGAGQTYDPFQMLDMDRAVERLVRSRKEGQRVVVYGDYDADGVTATALLFLALRRHAIDAGWYIPHRFEEGYGLNSQAVRALREQGAELLVSVDCGIRSVEIVREAARSGLDIIVTDHHLPGESLPPAAAVLNPHREHAMYPFRGLAGVGLAYKLAQALDNALPGGAPEELLDLVAVGTVADLAPLRGENRALVAAGLARLNIDPRPGLQALAQQAAIPPGSIDTGSIGFGLGPRINAAGRLDHASQAVELLLEESPDRAWELAARLDQMNVERRQLTERDLDRALSMLERGGTDSYVVLAVDDGFHQGVMGLVASRLAEQFYRPALVGRREGGLISGSARSIPEFHITEALEGCGDFLDRFGGHAMAAGFGLGEDTLESFRECLERTAAEALAGIELRPGIRIDARADLGELGMPLMEFIDRLQPLGQDNPYPVLASSPVNVLSKRRVGGDRRHLKLTLGQAGVAHDAIGFGMGPEADELGARLEVAYQLERNEFRGVTSLQLNLQGVRNARE